MSISSTEIIIVALVALIALGPQRLPEALRTAGKAYRQFKDVTGSVQREINTVVNETTGMVTGTAAVMTQSPMEASKPVSPGGPGVANESFRPDQNASVAPADEVPADEIASGSMGAAWAPADMVPADELPADDMSADELPGDGPSHFEAAAAEAPVDAAPVEAAPADALDPPADEPNRQA